MRILRLPTAFMLLTTFAVGCTEQPIPTAANDAVTTSTLDFAVEASNPFIGSWRITSAWLGDTDLLAGGLSLVQTFRSDLSYSWFLSNDFDHLACTSPDTNCSWDGTYEYTPATITLTEITGPEPGPDTSVYALVCGRLIMGDAGDEGEGGVMMVFKRTGR